ncbi:MAG: hypothetical protein WBC33_05630 [Conexibacter sp.]
MSQSPAFLRADLFSRLGSIPRRDSDYSYSATDAFHHFNVDAETLGAMRRAGLSVDGPSGQDLYTRFDLHYLGIRLGFARQHLWAIGLWRRSLDRFSSRAATQVRVTYVPQMPDVPAGAVGDVMLDGGVRRRVQLLHNEPACVIEPIMIRDWPAIPADIVSVLQEVASYEFCLMPPRLRGDTAMARDLQLLECWTAAKLIVDACEDLGHEAHIAHGLMIVLPFSNPHTWAEISVDGIWTPVDPLMITMMQRHATLDVQRWPCHRSLGPLLARMVVAEAPPPLVSIDGEPVAATYRTCVG